MKGDVFVLNFIVAEGGEKPDFNKKKKKECATYRSFILWRWV